MNKNLAGPIRWRMLSAAGVLAWAFTNAAAFPATLTIGQGTARVGDIAELTVDFASNGAPVSTLVVVLRYDPGKLAPFTEYYASVETDVTGTPILDNEGHTIPRTSPVRPGAAAQQAGRLFRAAVHPEGALAVAVWGDLRNVPEGALMTVAFRVLQGAAENERLPVEGVLAANPMIVEVPGAGETDTLASSAAGGATAQSVALTYHNGQVQVGCTTSSPVPQGVTASIDRTDAVLVSWTAVAGAEYRVYRNAAQNASAALALGQWASASSYLDATAPAPVQTGTGGCFGGASYEPVASFYWVKSRTAATLCESEYSAPVQGYRSLSEDQMAGSCGGGKTSPVNPDSPQARRNANSASGWPHTPVEAGNALVAVLLSLGFVLGGARMPRGR